MDKTKIYQLFLNELEAICKAAADAAREAHATATHSESVAENKYDTFGLESAYLAHGQSQRVLQYQYDLAEFKKLALPNLTCKSPITPGALVIIEDDAGLEKAVFLGPVSGGVKINFEEQTVSLVSVASPMGRELLGRFEGDSIAFAAGIGHKHYDIVSVR